MRLPRLAIENHQFTIVVVALLVLSGVVSFLTMPRSEDPLVTPPGSSIAVIYPGASPVDLEQLVVDPIEKVLNELEDIEEIVSVMEDGLAVVHIEFEVGSDADDKFSDVTQKVNSIRSSLPADILLMDIRKWSISDTKIMQLALVSPDEEFIDMQREAERLEKMLEKAFGVQGIEIEAYPEQEVHVSLDLEKMNGMNISLMQAADAIRSSSLNVPGGSVDAGRRAFTLHTSGDYASIEDIRRTIIATYAGKVVYLGDIADVSLGYEDRNYIARYNGERALFISISQKEGTNIFRVTGGIKRVLDEFMRSLPAGMSLETVVDQSLSVEERVNGFFKNFLQGVVLVGIVVLTALGIRASGIVMLVIPFSIIIAIGFIDVSGFGLQQMSIVGLVIALGLLVDNAIVVVENISRFMQMGFSRFESAVKGTSQIGWAIVSATVTTVLAFVPLAMLKSVSGDFLRSLPLAVIYCLSASLLLSLSLTPYLSSRFLRPLVQMRHKWGRRLLDRFIETRYRGILAWALSRPKTVIAVSLIVFISSLALFPVVGFSLFPKAEKLQLIVNVRAPKGTNLERTDEIARYVESVLMRREEVGRVASNVGHGNPRVYYNMFATRNRSYFAQFLVMLEEIDKKSMHSLIEQLRTEFGSFAGAEIEVKEFEQGPPVDAPIAIRVLGDNMDILEKVSEDIEELIRSTPGTVNIDNPLRTSKTDLKVDINRAKAAMLGVQLVDIDRTVRTAVAGTAVSRYRDPDGKEYDIVLRVHGGTGSDLDELDRIMVMSRTGARIPLKQLASIRFESAPPEINHYMLERSVMVTADVAAGYSIDRTSKATIARIDRYDFPKGYRYAVGGELESRQETFAGMYRAIVIAIIAIFGVLVLQFRSYRQPFIVFVAIPFAVTGSIFALLVTGYSFSFMAFVGLTSLMGIVINNSIILVVYTNQLRAEGKDVESALKEAGETRFVPIILTTATTICGLLPLTLIGGDVWGAMGWTIIGGLLVSTFLTLIMVPVIYNLAERRTVNGPAAENSGDTGQGMPE